LTPPDAYSVVIPAWNAARFIGPAIASILAQPAPPETIIVVDDGSTDDTAEAAAACGAGVKVVRQENAGPGAATNAGARLVTTPLIAFNDADDLWLPEKMALQTARLARDDLELVFGHVHLTRDGPAVETGARRPMWTRTTMLMRTASFRRTGALRDMPGLHGDMIEWVDRARYLGVRMAMMDEVVAIRRVHPASLTYRRGGEHGYLTAVKAALDRRRAAARAAKPAD
jgi:glycosyltransferase involved in cell wall biosynthesis